MIYYNKGVKNDNRFFKKDIDCSINFFIEKARILGKTNLVKEYTNLRKKEMPECIY